jgi:flagella synthesis protein FlgN
MVTEPGVTGKGKLSTLLAEELRTLRAFIVLLQREQSLLQEGAAERLSGLVGDKSDLSGELGRLCAARDEQLAQLGYTPDRNGMDAWIASSSGVSGQSDWHELLRLAGEARFINETNGKLIALHLKSNQQALNVLMTAVDQALTYGPDGQQRASSAGRSLGSA